MRKVKRYETGGDVEYETQDSEGNDINPDEMYSSTIDRNAQRLIAENEKKSTGNAGNKAVTRVSKTTRIEPIISEDRNKQMIADMKSEEAAEKVIRDKEWNKTQNEFDEKNKKGVGVGSSAAPTRGMRTRTEEEKAMGAKTFEEGFPSVIPGAIAGKGIKYAKGALDEMRAANAASKLNSVPMAKQLSGPSSTKMLEGPSTPKLLTGPKGEAKMLTSNASKTSAKNSSSELKDDRSEVEKILGVKPYSKQDSKSAGNAARKSERKDELSEVEKILGFKSTPKRGSKSAANAARKSESDLMDNYRRGKSFGDRDTGYKSGGSVSSASSRGDGIAQRGKTRGKVC
jgi:hypothetical protein